MFNTVNSSFYSDEEIQKLSKVRVGIAGSGGLGSNCAMILVRAGISKLILLDYDIIEASNLNRQFFFQDQIGKQKVEVLAENLKRVNPNLDLKIYNQKLEKKDISSVFEAADIIVEAFDNPKYKADLTEKYLLDEKPYICVSGIAGYGDIDRIKVREIGIKSWIVGDGKTGIDKAPPLAPAVMVAAAKEADLVLTAILDEI